MGLLSSIGKSLSSIGKKISSTYSTVDKKLGGYLPGGVSTGKVTTSEVKATTIQKASSSPTPTSSSSSKGGSYDTSTGTYTDTSGQKYSMSTVEALKKGAVITTPSSSSGTPISTVEAYQRVKGGAVSESLGLGSISEKLSTQRRLLRTEKTRSLSGNISPLKEAQLLGLTALSTVVDFGKDIVDLPETAYRIARNPKVLKELPAAAKTSAKNFGYVLRVSPGEAFVRVGGELLLMKGTGKAFESIKKTAANQLTKLNPKYVGEAKIGETLKIKTGSGKYVNLKVVGKIPKEALKSQIAKAGKRLNAISSQADSLLTMIKKSKIVRKPIPGEATFSAATKKLLKQFDEGVISKKNLLKLNEAIKKQGAKGLLERSFFADPTGKIRPSRLGVIKESKGSILDYFTEDITFKKAKPQILLFENVKVQNLPTALKSIGTKLKKGAALTKAEADKLLKFQLKKSGKFKPIGFLSGESEITLPPGEILKKVKKVGVTIANGKKIPIVKAEVFKPTGKIKTLLTKFRKGELTKAQTKTLDNMLKKATGFNYGLSSAKKVAGKYIDIKKIGAAALSKLSRKKPTVTTKTIAPTKVTVKTSPHPEPKKPTSKPTSLTSKAKVKKTSGSKGISSYSTKSTKQTSKPSSAKKTTTKKLSSSQLAASRRRKKKASLSSRRPATSQRKSAYYGSKRKVSYSGKSPGRSPRKPVKSKSPISPRKYPKSPKSPTYHKSPAKSPGKPVKSVKTITSTTKKRKVSRKPKIGYAIYEKRGKKGFVKLKGLPLTKSQAKDRLAYRLDNKISRTAKLVPIKNVRKLGSLPKQQKGYFNRYKSNLRNYKIVKGKRVKTPLTFIEKKGKGVISTTGEKRQLALNRKYKSSPRKVSRSITKTRTVKRSSRRQTANRRSAQNVNRNSRSASKSKTQKNNRRSTSRNNTKPKRRTRSRDPFAGVSFW